MTTYTAILSTETDPGKPVKSDLMKRLSDNPKATAEGDTSAPAMATGWLNYDGSQTLTPIYDSAISGALATVSSPDFANGWQYQFIFENVTTSGGVAADLQLEIYREASAAYSTAGVILTDVATSVKGLLSFLHPRYVSNHHLYYFLATDLSGSSNSGAYISTVNQEDARYIIIHSTAQKLLRVRLSFNAGTINGGKIYMMRQQVGFTR